MPCYSPLKGWKDRDGKLVFKNPGHLEKMDVACGQCLGCRLDRSRMWASRIAHEASLYADGHGSSFVTLTYRPKHEATREEVAQGYYIPDDWSLDKKHFQDFMKRLRKEYSDRKIKYFHCGEYGKICKHGIDLEAVRCPVCKLGRPHYHACLLNVQFDDLQEYATQNGVVRYTSSTLESLWKRGFVDVGKLEFQSAAYVARYMLKKVTGDNAEEHYTRVDVETGEVVELQPEYATMSNGIGKEWYEKYKKDVFPSDVMPVPGHGNVHKAPRYYEEMYKAEFPEEHEKLKKKRMKYKEENPQEFEPDRLKSKYIVKKAQTELLKRQI